MKVMKWLNLAAQKGRCGKALILCSVVGLYANRHWWRGAAGEDFL
jgi:hypothetical protein